MITSRLESLLEVSINVGSGFIVSWVYWELVMSELLRDGAVSLDDGFTVTTHYTVLAVVRGYLWRRFFAAGLHRRLHGRLK